MKPGVYILLAVLAAALAGSGCSEEPPPPEETYRDRYVRGKQGAADPFTPSVTIPEEKQTTEDPLEKRLDELYGEKDVSQMEQELLNSMDEAQREKYKKIKQRKRELIQKLK